MVIDISHVPPRRSYDLTWSWSGTGDEDSPYTVTVTATNERSEERRVGKEGSSRDVAPPYIKQAHNAVSAPENLPATNSGVFSGYDDTMVLSPSQGTPTN